MKTPVIEHKVNRMILKAFGNRQIRASGLRTAYLALRYFFGFQFKTALLKGRIPISQVDHPLDERIPFLPSRVGIYLDFIFFWIRAADFLLVQIGKRALSFTCQFINGMGDLYFTASKVYSKNVSTTKRPLYLSHPRFLLIHFLDPHLLCIPSLHVMIVIRAYTHFRSILRSLGAEDRYSTQITEMRKGALRITDSVMYVKQHSINCISAAMYAMTRYDADLFPQEEAILFANDIFSIDSALEEDDREAIRMYIIDLYNKFLQEGQAEADWTQPLLSFLAECPRKK
jgi:hypothetical protein